MRNKASESNHGGGCAIWIVILLLALIANKLGAC